MPFLVAIAVASCDRAVAPEAAAEPELTADSAISVLTEALAGALAVDEQIRRDLHSAMQASPWNEHKLVLPEYFETEAGSALGEAVAGWVSSEPISLDKAFAVTGRLDFYMPFRAQRETWDGAVAPIVIGGFDPDDEFRGFWATGKPYVYAGTAPGVPVWALHRAEDKRARSTSMSAQDPDVISQSVLGDVPADTSFLMYVHNSVSDAVGDAEVRILFKFLDTEDSSFASQWFAVDLAAGADVNLESEPFALFPHVLPDSSDLYIKTLYYEDDGEGEGGSLDLYGVRLIYWDDNDTLVNIWHVSDPNRLVGQVEVEWVPASPQAVDSLHFNWNHVDLDEGQSTTLIVKAYDPNAYHIEFSNSTYPDADITSISSSNTSVATVSSASESTRSASATVDAVGPGSAWIRVTTQLRGTVTDSVSVWVNECTGQLCTESGGGGVVMEAGG